jgi:hypothetical protein
MIVAVNSVRFISGSLVAVLAVAETAETISTKALMHKGLLGRIERRGIAKSVCDDYVVA